MENDECGSGFAIAAAPEGSWEDEYLECPRNVSLLKLLTSLRKRGITVLNTVKYGGTECSSTCTHMAATHSYIYNVEKRGMECRVCTEKRYEYTKDSAHLLYKKNSTVVLLLCIFLAFSETDINTDTDITPGISLKSVKLTHRPTGRGHDPHEEVA